MVDFRMLGRGLRAAAACVALAAVAACNEGATPSAAQALPVAGTPAGNPGASAPVISGTPTNTVLPVGQPFTFTPSAGSPTGATLGFLLMSAPAFLSIDPSTGVVSGTPAAVDIGTYAGIRVAVTDGTTTVAGPAFTLTVVGDPASNGPTVTGALTISGAPITAAVEGVAWSFRPTVTVVSAGATLTFRAANLPPWMTVAQATGTLSGTPPAGSVGTYANIVLSVSDGTSEVALPAFSLSVSAPRPPSISGTPPTAAKAGIAYSFRPTATDPNGYPLVFTITGKPAWATFDPRTGTLSGVPTAGDAGTSSSMSITASDGFSSATLPAFTVTVAAGASSGSATLSWVAPTSRTDGTALTNLAGFRIYYGTTSGSYPNSISITNPKLTGYTIDALPPGTYYFVTTAFDAFGNESAYSNPVSKTIG
jgi:Putative Ig domain